MTIADGKERLIERWRQLARRFDALALRERAALAIAVVAAMLAVWDRVVLQPLIARERAARAQLETLTPDGAASTAAAELERLLEEEKKLLLQHYRKRAELEARVASLIDPQRMPDVLTELLRTRPGVKLERLANLPVEELKAAPSTAPVAAAAVVDASEDGGASAGLADELTAVPAVAYVHGIELEVSGRYDALREFLEAVERAPYQLLWRRIELQANEYPRIKAHIVVASLSLERHWLSL
ncbi:MAG: hypothetical protein NZM12_02310 [Steroidobacteraceae bacterium]|nr:hypothetical protein [Steroidobacteraceae bacterium]MDW8259804.1 hypothetical protein [Gammaproteobacteria bacterium]